MELLTEFGVNPVLLTAQIINFLIIAYVLKRYLYGPILDLLKKREQTIKKGQEDAVEAGKLLAKTEEREKEILKKAQTEAKAIIEAAKVQQADMLAKAEEATKVQADAMLQEARASIAYEVKETEKRLAEHVSGLAITFLQKSISGIFTEKEQDAIMANALAQIKKEKN
jgi:F-type H+-transporting ATPase subunit b